MPSSATSAAISNNPLLVKDSVGKSRPTVYDLPGQNHVYGKKVERNPEECAAQVLQNWNVKAKSKHAVPALDYISMNRNTAKQGISSPSEIRQYRKSHPIRMKIGESNISRGLNGANGGSNNGDALTSAEIRKQRLLGPLPHEKDPNFTYGEPTRPSTPVALLMTDVYQREWIEEQERRVQEKQTREKEKAKTKQTKTVTPAKVPLPKKQVLVDKDPKTLFKMSKFKSAGPKITSWRTSDDPALNFQSTKVVQLSFKNGGKSGNAGNIGADQVEYEEGGAGEQRQDDVAAAAEPAAKVEKGVRFA
ncbi:hypothetical protein HDU76_008620 [Blyttiomyces sp. JEL0837]|nr:hypothetical protein HDU76_008620 [Blyttiomyces sp. JEL0837]